MGRRQRVEPGRFVRDLATVDEGMLGLVGGKGANLGRLLREGMPVPPGFCVTTDAYAAMAATTDLPRVCSLLADTDPSDADALARHARHARESVLRAPVPAEVETAVVAAYRALPGGPDAAVAVRSSATAEDLPTASFAGQQDTYLNVVGATAAVEAVRACWASLWTDRAVSYRSVQGIDHSTVRLAVVVQRMVDAAVAGVLFTADPVTGRRHQAVVDAGPGLGEAVVSGAVNPDHFVVDTETGVVLRRRPGDKRLAVRAVPGGGTEQTALPPGTSAPSLDDARLRELTALGARVEERFECPQDIEWAVDARGTLWLTQARPITTLFPVPRTRSVRPAPLRVFFCMSLAQGLHRPLTPMGLSAFDVLGSSVAGVAGLPRGDAVLGPPAVTSAASRLFLDVTALVRHPVGRAVFPRVLDVMEARSAVALRAVLDDPRLAPLRGGRARFAGRLARGFVRYRVPATVVRALVRPASVHREVRRLADEVEGRCRPRAGASPYERLDAVVEMLSTNTVTAVPRVAPAVAVGFGLLGLARAALGPDARPGDLQTVLRGLPHNVTTEMDLHLWDLAARVRDDDAASAALLGEDAAGLAAHYHAGSLPPVAQQGLASFLARYGHRAVAEIDLGVPRWRDDPAHLLGVLANYLRLPADATDPRTEFDRAAARARAMAAALRRRAGRRGRVRAAFVGFALRRARELAGLREMPKYLIVLAFAGARAELVEIGRHLAGQGRLATAEDVFFLDLRDVRVALDGADQRVLVRHRREAYDREMGRRRIPRLLLSDGTEPEATLGLDAAEVVDGLRGTAASAGSTVGRARVVLDPVGARLEPGEILVAPSTDPGWTPLFLTAGGLVMEMGGANSHGAVVAREYGIPAVVGVPDATTAISTGQHVLVDGSTGVVRQVEEPGSA